MEGGGPGVLEEVAGVRVVIDCYLLLGGCVLAYAAVTEACEWLVTWLDGDDE